ARRRRRRERVLRRGRRDGGAQVRALLALPRRRRRRRRASDDRRPLHRHPVRRRRAARGALMAARRAGALAPWLGIALTVIVLDQITKAMIVAAFQLGDARRVTSFFDVVRAHNRGAAFSFLNEASGWQRWFFIVLGLAAAVFIVWLLARHGGQRMFSWALALILGGALGNVIDRVLHGHVV